MCGVLDLSRLGPGELARWCSEPGHALVGPARHGIRPAWGCPFPVDAVAHLRELLSGHRAWLAAALAGRGDGVPLEDSAQLHAAHVLERLRVEPALEAEVRQAARRTALARYRALLPELLAGDDHRAGLEGLRGRTLGCACGARPCLEEALWQALNPGDGQS